MSNAEKHVTKSQEKPMNPALTGLIKLLARIAVDDYLEDLRREKQMQSEPSD